MNLTLERVTAPSTQTRDIQDRYIKPGLRFNKYLNEIEEITGREISPKQKTYILKSLEENKYYRLSPDQTKSRRKEFSKNKKELINEWERETGLTWNKYKKPVYSKTGKIVRNIGQPYDAHHVIELSWGGPAVWWNLIPARFPDEHQQGIHGKGSIANTIFGSC